MPSPTDRNFTALPTDAVNPPRGDRRRQARHFTQLDQVTQLVAAREADSERKGRLRRNTNAGTGRCRYAVSGKKEWITSGYMLQVCKGSDRRGIDDRFKDNNQM